MKSKSLGLAVLAAATAALVAACGGGGGSQASVQLTGVAATGLALANSTVDVKCASGTGSATTNESGSYTVTVSDGKLPCIVKVTGMAGGVPVTLHSLAEGTGTTATANVTPLTEMILARAAGTMPADLFENFSDSAVTGSALSQATTDILTVLGGALGIDLSGVDPFKATLVAATTSNPTGGNGYDQLLDQLGETVTPAMLPQVVSQIASTIGSSAPVTLEQVVANVQAGSLAGCPQALSGKYRIVDYVGASDVVDINFGTLRLKDAEGEHVITPHSEACRFDVDGAYPTTVVIGPSGAGAIRDKERVGYIFPVQAHTFAAVQGKWDFIESGIEDGVGIHFVGDFTVAADGSVSVCDYYDAEKNVFSTTCSPNDESVSLQAASDGTFTLNYGTDASRVFGFRAPNGTLTLFGSNDPGESAPANALRSSFVMTRPQSTPVPVAGSTSRFWELLQKYNSGTLSADEVSADAVTNSEVTATSVTRTRVSDGRVDTWQLDQPIAGLRHRTDANPAYQRFLPGTGLLVHLDAKAPPEHTFVVVVSRN